MDLKQPPKIVSAQRSEGGVVIEFEDGSAAFYPASLLAEVFSRAQKLEEIAPDAA